jgi:hypothetical protein
LNRFASKDFLAGLMFVTFGVAALWFGRHLAIGTAIRMGPGYVPRALSFILLGLGGFICVLALVSGSEPTKTPRWKPITLVTLGIVAFALLFERLGMLPALVALVGISSVAGQEFKLAEVVGNMVVLTILCIVVFKLGLGMNIAVIQGLW